MDEEKLRDRIIRTKAFRGNGDDGVEAGDSSEVDRVESYLHNCRDKDSVHRYVRLRMHLADDPGERQTLVTGKCVDGAGTLGHQRVRREEGDDGDQRGKRACAADGTGGVVEDGNERNTGG